MAATPWEDVLALLHKEFGDSLETSFQEIEAALIDSASLAQVHAAILADGAPVEIVSILLGLWLAISIIRSGY